MPDDDYSPYQGVMVDEEPPKHEDLSNIPGIHYSCYICGWTPKHQSEYQYLNKKLYEKFVPKEGWAMKFKYRYIISYCTNCGHHFKT